MLEMAFLVLFSGVLTTLAVPTSKALESYNLNAAVKDVTRGIHSARFLAIVKGHSYNIAFNQNTNNYQVGYKIPPATVFTNSGNPIPWSGSNGIAISPSTTLQFSPGGTVTATTGTLSFTLTSGTKVETITVSPIGDVTVTP